MEGSIQPISFGLNNCVCKSYNEGDNKRFVIQTQNKKPLFKDVEKIEVLAEAMEANAWYNAFGQSGILLRNSDPSGMVACPPTRDFEEVKK